LKNISKKYISYIDILELIPILNISKLSHGFYKIHETFVECSILFKFKEGENFNQRNISDISRIKI